MTAGFLAISTVSLPATALSAENPNLQQAEHEAYNITRHLTNLKHNIKSTEQHIDELKQALERAEHARNPKRQIEHLKEEIEKKLSELKQLKKAKKSKAEIEKLDRIVDKMHQDLIKLEKSGSSAFRQIENMKQNLARMLNKLHSMKRQYMGGRHAAENLMHHLDGWAQHLEQQIKEEMAQVHKMEKFRNSMREIDGAKRDFKKLIGEIEAMEKAKKPAAEIEKIKHEIANLEHMIKTKEEAKKDMRGVTTAKKFIAKGQNELRQTGAFLNHLKRELQHL
ncbi:MAG: hypothetical protein OQJ97_16560 [Rhodospirillales bacterium]|nr:hypothetical protein [Rhodospirillales bacterium]